ncbi:MAG TPA: helix-turn-helix domain-containing protein [Pseudonocardia sp.]|jgi:transcriptional regulator of acetoin/glycerol metabolism|nr:helix-turn-helix domain-containing protein [Pseudonocardia sp.]
MWAVPPEIESPPPYRPDINTETKLLRVASRLVPQFVENLGDIGIVFSVAETGARMIGRWPDASDVARLMDSVHSAPGFVYAEDTVGTNGIGTAIETGRTTRIDGQEHYSESLRFFTCVGVPIFDRITGRQHGVLVTGSRADESNHLVTVVTEQVARSIEEQLYQEHSRIERALLEQFLAARVKSRGVLVVNERLQMSDPVASRILSGVEQETIWELAARALHQQCSVEQTFSLQNGRRVNTEMRALGSASDRIGVLIRIVSTEDDAPDGPGADQLDVTGDKPLPGLVAGQSAPRADGPASSACRHALAAATKAKETGSVLVIAGKAGTGKTTVARQLHNSMGTGELTVIEADSASHDLDRQIRDAHRKIRPSKLGTLLIKHIDNAPRALERATSELLLAATRRNWVCLVTSADELGVSSFSSNEISSVYLNLLPLRDRIDELPGLASEFALPRRLAPEVTQLLMRLPWPRNLWDLQSVIGRLLGETSDPVIGIGSVPAELRRRAPRRQLTRFEMAELEAILSALDQCAGNKREAAKRLGISRTTLYRKLQTAGLALDRTAY